MLAAVGVGVAGTAAFEYASFRGAFDHRSLPGPARPGSFREARDAAGGDGDADWLFHVGHSTHVITLGGVRFLTDPWFYDPAFGAMKHEVGPACAPSEMDIHALLISHDHADHCDEKALDEMAKSTPCFVGTPALAAKLKRLGFTEVSVLGTWESARVQGVEVHAVTAIHDVPEIGFVLRSPSSPSAAGATLSVYFAGDSALHPDLERIAEEFAPAVSILPVDGTRLRGDALRVMRPEDAVEAARRLKSATLLPSHAEARFYDPIAKHVLTENIEGANQKFAALMRSALPEREVRVPAPGDRVLLRDHLG
ncbi:MAG: MBL fold metallo-hydrolase [Polyangiaceae bacterium]